MELAFQNIKLYAGSLWNWEEDLSDYPAHTYELKLLLRKGSAAVKTITAAADGTKHSFTNPVATTAGYDNGEYSYQMIATNRTDASELVVIDSGTKHIFPLLSSASDPRTYWERILQNLKDAYETLSSKEADSVNVNGKTITYKNIDRLITQIKHAEAELARITGSARPKIFKSRFV